MSRNFKIEYVTYKELLKAYWDCLKRKRSTQNARDFMIQDAEKLYNLWLDLNYKRYEIGPSIAFCVDVPVKREVFAADFRDRIIHHLVINRINKYLEENFIQDSYSCRKGKGTEYGITRCAEFIKEASDNYKTDVIIVKGDLKSFFMTVNKDILYNGLESFLRRKYPSAEDLDYTLWLIKLIIYNRPQDYCIRKQPKSKWIGLPSEKSLFSCPDNLGLPIGNLTSQIFANFYLSDFDWFIVNDLGIKYYGRYVDDFFFIVPSAEDGHRVLEKCRAKLLEVGVKLHPKKIYIQEVKKGVQFVGAVIKPMRLYLTNRTKGNFWLALQIWADFLEFIKKEGRKPTTEEIEKFVNSINSYLGFSRHRSTFNIRKKMMFSEYMSGWYHYCYIDSDLTKLTVFEDYSYFKNYKGKKNKRQSKSMYLNLNKYGELLDKFGCYGILSKLEKSCCL